MSLRQNVIDFWSFHQYATRRIFVFRLSAHSWNYNVLVAFSDSWLHVFPFDDALQQWRKPRTLHTWLYLRLPFQLAQWKHHAWHAHPDSSVSTKTNCCSQMRPSLCHLRPLILPSVRSLQYSTALTEVPPPIRLWTVTPTIILIQHKRSNNLTCGRLLVDYNKNPYWLYWSSVEENVDHHEHFRWCC